MLLKYNSYCPWSLVVQKSSDRRAEQMDKFKKQWFGDSVAVVPLCLNVFKFHVTRINGITWAITTVSQLHQSHWCTSGKFLSTWFGSPVWCWTLTSYQCDVAAEHGHTLTLPLNVLKCKHAGQSLYFRDVMDNIESPSIELELLNSNVQ